MLKDLVLRNRSYRGFNSARPVTREELLDMVDCARFCASSINHQPFKYYLAHTPEAVSKILPQTKWAKGLPDVVLPHAGMEPAAFIVICQDFAISDNLPRHQRDCGIVAQTILLRAVELGLGGCMIGSFNAGPLREALELPETVKPLLVLALGEPAEEVVLEEAGPGESVAYYRDGEDRHHVPKRRLEDIVL